MQKDLTCFFRANLEMLAFQDLPVSWEKKESKASKARLVRPGLRASRVPPANLELRDLLASPERPALPEDLVTRAPQAVTGRMAWMAAQALQGLLDRGANLEKMVSLVSKV